MKNFIPLRLNSNEPIKMSRLTSSFPTFGGGPLNDVVHHRDGTCTVMHDNGTTENGHTVHNGDYIYCVSPAGRIILA